MGGSGGLGGGGYMNPMRGFSSSHPKGLSSVSGAPTGHSNKNESPPLVRPFV
jgi:hypothetical protein